MNTGMELSVHPSVCLVSIELTETQMQIQYCKSFGLNQRKPCGADARCPRESGVFAWCSLVWWVVLSDGVGPLLQIPFCHQKLCVSQVCPMLTALLSASCS